MGMTQCSARMLRVETRRSVRMHAPAPVQLPARQSIYLQVPSLAMHHVRVLAQEAWEPACTAAARRSRACVAWGMRALHGPCMHCMGHVQCMGHACVRKGDVVVWVWGRWEGPTHALLYA